MVLPVPQPPLGGTQPFFGGLFQAANAWLPGGAHGQQVQQVLDRKRLAVVAPLGVMHAFFRKLMAVFDHQAVKRALAHMLVGTGGHAAVAHRARVVARDVNFFSQNAFGDKVARIARTHCALGKALHLDVGDVAIAHVNARMLHRHPQVGVQHAAGHGRDGVAERGVDKVLDGLEQQARGQQTGGVQAHRESRQSEGQHINFWVNAGNMPAMRTAPRAGTQGARCRRSRVAENWKQANTSASALSDGAQHGWHRFRP